MDIEDVAHNTPEKIHTLTIDPATGLMPHHGRSVAKALNLTGDLAKQAAKVTQALYNAFIGTEIGRASCRERVCQYGVALGGRRIIKTKTTETRQFTRKQ